MKFNTGSGGKQRKFFCWTDESGEFMASVLETVVAGSYRPIARFDSREALEAEIARRNGETVWQE